MHRQRLWTTTFVMLLSSAWSRVASAQEGLHLSPTERRAAGLHTEKSRSDKALDEDCLAKLDEQDLQVLAGLAQSTRRLLLEPDSLSKTQQMKVNFVRLLAQAGCNAEKAASLLENSKLTLKEVLDGAGGCSREKMSELQTAYEVIRRNVEESTLNAIIFRLAKALKEKRPADASLLSAGEREMMRTTPLISMPKLDATGQPLVSDGQVILEPVRPDLKARLPLLIDAAKNLGPALGALEKHGVEANGQTGQLDLQYCDVRRSIKDPQFVSAMDYFFHSDDKSVPGFAAAAQRLQLQEWPEFSSGNKEQDEEIRSEKGRISIPGLIITPEVTDHVHAGRQEEARELRHRAVALSQAGKEEEAQKLYRAAREAETMRRAWRDDEYWDAVARARQQFEDHARLFSQYAQMASNYQDFVSKAALEGHSSPGQTGMSAAANLLARDEEYMRRELGMSRSEMEAVYLTFRDRLRKGGAALDKASETFKSNERAALVALSTLGFRREVGGSFMFGVASSVVSSVGKARSAAAEGQGSFLCNLQKEYYASIGQSVESAAKWAVVNPVIGKAGGLMAQSAGRLALARGLPKVLTKTVMVGAHLVTPATAVTGTFWMEPGRDAQGNLSDEGYLNKARTFFYNPGLYAMTREAKHTADKSEALELKAEEAEKAQDPEGAQLYKDMARLARVEASSKAWDVGFQAMLTVPSASGAFREWSEARYHEAQASSLMNQAGLKTEGGGQSAFTQQIIADHLLERGGYRIDAKDPFFQNFAHRAQIRSGYIQGELHAVEANVFPPAKPNLLALPNTRRKYQEGAAPFAGVKTPAQMNQHLRENLPEGKWKEVPKPDLAEVQSLVHKSLVGVEMDGKPAFFAGRLERVFTEGKSSHLQLKAEILDSAGKRRVVSLGRPGELQPLHVLQGEPALPTPKEIQSAQNRNEAQPERPLSPQEQRMIHEALTAAGAKGQNPELVALVQQRLAQEVVQYGATLPSGYANTLKNRLLNRVPELDQPAPAPHGIVAWALSLNKYTNRLNQSYRSPVRLLGRALSNRIFGSPLRDAPITQRARYYLENPHLLSEAVPLPSQPMLEAWHGVLKKVAGVDSNGQVKLPPEVVETVFNRLGRDYMRTGVPYDTESPAFARQMKDMVKVETKRLELNQRRAAEVRTAVARLEQKEGRPPSSKALENLEAALLSEAQDTGAVVEARGPNALKEAQKIYHDESLLDARAASNKAILVEEGRFATQVLSDTQKALKASGHAEPLSREEQAAVVEAHRLGSFYLVGEKNALESRSPVEVIREQQKILLKAGITDLKVHDAVLGLTPGAARETLPRLADIYPAVTINGKLQSATSLKVLEDAGYRNPEAVWNLATTVMREQGLNVDHQDPKTLQRWKDGLWEARVAGYDLPGRGHVYDPDSGTVRLSLDVQKMRVAALKKAGVPESVWPALERQNVVDDLPRAAKARRNWGGAAPADAISQAETVLGQNEILRGKFRLNDKTRALLQDVYAMGASPTAAADGKSLINPNPRSVREAQKQRLRDGGIKDERFIEAVIGSAP